MRTSDILLVVSSLATSGLACGPKTPAETTEVPANSQAIGSGTALAAAPVAMLRGDIAGLATALRLARRPLTTIRQNLFWAFVYNVLDISIAAGVLAPWTG